MLKLTLFLAMMTSTEFQVTALGWLTAISVVGGTILGFVIRALLKYWPEIMLLKEKYDQLQGRADRHSASITTLQTNTLPPALLQAAAATLALPAPAAPASASALADNTAATQANTAAVNAQDAKLPGQ